MNISEIEVLKHRASWMNSLATAVGTTGVLAPIAAYITGAIPTGSDVGVVLMINGLCVIIAIMLHIQGWMILSEIE